MTHVFLHIGLPKTGTTTIQAALDACAADLAAAGVLVPGGGHAAHRLAGFDLVGERVRGEDARRRRRLRAAGRGGTPPPGSARR